MPDSRGLGRRVLQARLGMGARMGRAVTQAEVAKRIGVTQGTVGRWEGGTKEPALATIEKLADVFGVSPAWLAFGVESPAATEQRTPWPVDAPGKPPSAAAREAKSVRKRA